MPVASYLVAPYSPLRLLPKSPERSVHGICPNCKLSLLMSRPCEAPHVPLAQSPGTTCVVGNSGQLTIDNKASGSCLTNGQHSSDLHVRASILISFSISDQAMSSRNLPPAGCAATGHTSLGMVTASLDLACCCASPPDRCRACMAAPTVAPGCEPTLDPIGPELDRPTGPDTMGPAEMACWPCPMLFMLARIGCMLCIMAGVRADGAGPGAALIGWGLDFAVPQPPGASSPPSAPCRSVAFIPDADRTAVPTCSYGTCSEPVWHLLHLAGGAKPCFHGSQSAPQHGWNPCTLAAQGQLQEEPHLTITGRR